MSSSDKNLPVDKERVSYADQETREENDTAPVATLTPDPNDNKAASTTTGGTETNAGGPTAVGQSVASGSNSVSGSSLGGNIMNTSKSGSSANVKSGSATAGTSPATSNTGGSQKSAGKTNTAPGDKSRKSDQKSKSKSSKKSTAKKNVISVKTTAKGSVSSNSSSGSNKSTSVKSKPPQVSSKSQPATVPPVSNAKAAPTPKKATAAPKNRESFVNPIASTIGSRIFTKPDLGGLEVDSSLHFEPPMVTANEIANLKAQPCTTPTTTVIASQPATGPLPVKTSSAPSASSKTPTSSNPPISMPPPIEQCNGAPNLSGNNGSNVGVTNPNNSGTSTQFSPGLITKGAAIADASGPVGSGSSIGASKSEPFNEEGANVNNAPSSTTVTPITSIVHLDSGAGTFSATRLPSEYPVPASASNCGTTASTTALPQVDSLSQYKVESASNVNNNASNQSLDTGNSLGGGSSSTNTSSDINFNQFK